jgi:large subunit ribosomal protein L24
MSIRRDDVVEVLKGKSRGHRGRVLRVLPAEGKVVVEGANRVYKHLKPNRQNMQGGRLSKEMPLPVCNVALVCPTCNRGTRLGRRYADDGSKRRYCKKCGNEYPGAPLSPPRPAYARKP